MAGMTEDQDRFDEFVRREAPTLRQPPATPRDEMWAAIAATRHTRARSMVQQRRWTRLVTGLAAILLLGIAIGRYTVPGGAGDGATATQQEFDDGLIYRTVASEHLGRAEALLSMFRSDAASGRSDDNASRAARGLLSANRLLLDSPAAADPRMRRLLEDLELVLAQIAQLSAEQGTDPTEFIMQALDENSVLFRLRAAIPTPFSQAATEGEL
jgi:hypothetical protein